MGFFGADKTVGAKRMNSLATYLVRRGISVAVMTTSKKYEMPAEFGAIDFFYVDEIPMNSSPIRNEKAFNHNKIKFEEAFLKNIEDINPDVILISGSPFYTFSITGLAKEKGIPCVIDIRDPWIFDFRGLKNTLSFKKNMYRIIHYPHERYAIANATAVVTVTDGWCEDYRRHYKWNQDKFHVVENGFDELGLADIDAVEADKEIENLRGVKLGVFGKLAYYSDNNTKVLLQGFKRVDEKSVHIVQIGEKEKVVEQIAHEIGAPNDTIISTGFMDYKKGIATLKKLDALLIIDNRMHALGTKIYDYIFVNKPIIYIGPKRSDMAKLVGKFENGYCCSNVHEVEEAIRKIVDQKPKKLQEEYDKNDYSRDRQNRKYEELLQSVCIR